MARKKKSATVIRTSVPSLGEVARILGIPHRSSYIRRVAETFEMTVDLVYSFRIATGPVELIEVELDRTLVRGPSAVYVGGRKVKFRFDERNGRVVIRRTMAAP